MMILQRALNLQKCQVHVSRFRRHALTALQFYEILSIDNFLLRATVLASGFRFLGASVEIVVRQPFDSAR